MTALARLDQREVGPGLTLLRARLRGVAYRRHRHDRYALGITETGVQRFDYRGAAQVSLPGEVVVLHPDEPHDGRAGTAAGFGYRILYVAPERIAEAAHALDGRPVPLPFVAEPVGRHPDLAAALYAAFRDARDGMVPLAADALLADVTTALLAAAAAPRRRASPLDGPALERARDRLDAAAEAGETLGSTALEAASGLDRFTLARQFRRRYGTSPHRYLVLRRLDRVRAALAGPLPLATIAADVGFADQAHMTRQFRAAFGLPPGRFRALLGG